MRSSWLIRIIAITIISFALACGTATTANASAPVTSSPTAVNAGATSASFPYTACAQSWAAVTVGIAGAITLPVAGPVTGLTALLSPTAIIGAGTIITVANTSAMQCLRYIGSMNANQICQHSHYARFDPRGIIARWTVQLATWNRYSQC